MDCSVFLDQEDNLIYSSLQDILLHIPGLIFSNSVKFFIYLFFCLLDMIQHMAVSQNPVTL